MQRNLILAVVLSSLVYIGWYSYLGKNLKPPAAGAQTAAAAAAQGGMGFGGTLQTGAEGAAKPTTTGGKTLLGQ